MISKTIGWLTSFLPLLLLLVARPLVAQDIEPVRFDRDVRPILSNNCFHCHGPDEGQRQGELRLDIQQEVFAKREGGTAVVPGKLQASQLWLRIASQDPEVKMPPPDSPKSLTVKERDVIKRWIEQGARWSDHWAFVPPVRPALPAVAGEWGNNEIDRFVRKRMNNKGLQPAPEADRYTLARRLSFDLTGLPPEPADVKAFVKDAKDGAYERYVDKLLASQHFGERMAIPWLDAARYGDTSVFHADGPRDMWAWRDWVVRSYNQNKSFKDFSFEQLAGDLLPEGTAEQRIATGFNRNNATTDEGGLIEEEYRVEYIVDRVRTMSMVWLGLSLECAQCHDHKYDPFTMQDYYQVFAYYNQSSDRGKQTRRGNEAPIEQYFDPERTARAGRLQSGFKGLRQQLVQREKVAEGDFAKWLTDVLLDAGKEKIDPRPVDTIVHLPLDETKGKNVADQVVKGRQGQVQGKEQWVAGKIKNAFKTDGGAFIDMGDIIAFDRHTPFSMGCWIQPTADLSGAPLGKMAEAENNRGFMIDLSGGTVQVMLSHTWPNRSIMVHSVEKVKADQWQHLYVTYDGSSKASGVTLYLDGMRQELAIKADSLDGTIVNSQPLLIGRRYRGAKGSPFKGLLDDVRMYHRELGASEVASLAGADPITPLLALADRNEVQQQALRQYYLGHHDKAYQAILNRLRDQGNEITSLRRAASTVMVMKDVAKPRDTFVLKRGQYDQPSDVKVLPRPLELLTAQPENSPANRLGLARWLFQDNHPLTARVAVNRYWLLLFGKGLVATPEDFGSQGAFPSHPDLLDWLAVDFRESGWDIKRMLKQIVMSATYRQSSRVTPQLLEQDPENLLLARGPRFRLQAEFVRDAALATSGLLVRQTGGPGGKVYQPPGLWAQVGLGGNPKFVMDHGEKLYRRSLYTYWKRSSPPPNMQIFDAPTREKCIINRSRTNTPLQALVLLNDVQFVEAARNLAERILSAANKTDEQRIADLYEIVLSRPPYPAELPVVLEVLRDAQQRYGTDRESAKKLLGFGESKRKESIDVATHAAWTMLCSMVLNLDETVTRN